MIAEVPPIVGVVKENEQVPITDANEDWRMIMNVSISVSLDVVSNVRHLDFNVIEDEQKVDVGIADRHHSEKDSKIRSK